MSHVRSDQQRNDNAAIRACMERNRAGRDVEIGRDFDDNPVYRWDAGNYTCGPSETLSPAQDRCPQCGKVFTY